MRALVFALLAGCAPLDEPEPWQEPFGVEDGLTLIPVAEGLQRPVRLVGDPWGGQVVADRPGLLWRIRPDGQREEAPWLDLRHHLGAQEADRGPGLIDLAFHPVQPALFVSYAAPPHDLRDRGLRVVLTRFDLVEGRPDAGSEAEVMEVVTFEDQRIGGALAFDLQGRLVWALGDGGDPAAAQDPRSAPGSVLRLDVDQLPPAIPPDNPFAAGGPGAPEVMAYGLRDPQGLAIDHDTLLLADRGQDLMEEVSQVSPGANLGWPLRKGLYCFAPDAPESPPEDCAETGPLGEPLVDPVLAYQHAGAEASPPSEVPVLEASGIVGGQPYQGSALPALRGRYLLADRARSPETFDGVLLVGWPDEGIWHLSRLAVDGLGDGRLDRKVLGLGEDGDGEIHVLTVGPEPGSGRVWRLGAREGGGLACPEPCGPQQGEVAR